MVSQVVPLLATTVVSQFLLSIMLSYLETIREHTIRDWQNIAVCYVYAYTYHVIDEGVVVDYCFFQLRQMISDKGEGKSNINSPRVD